MAVQIRSSERKGAAFSHEHEWYLSNLNKNTIIIAYLCTTRKAVPGTNINVELLGLKAEKVTVKNGEGNHLPHQGLQG